MIHSKKAKNLIPDVAAQLEMSEDLIKTVTDFYWRDVRKSMSSLVYPRIHITNLGDFVVKHWKINDKIDMLEKFEENNKQKGMQQITARFKTAENLFELKNMKKLLDEELDRKEFVKVQKQIAHEIKQKEYNKNLEKQGSDN